MKNVRRRGGGWWMIIGMRILREERDKKRKRDWTGHNSEKKNGVAIHVIYACPGVIKLAEGKTQYYSAGSSSERKIFLAAFVCNRQCSNRRCVAEADCCSLGLTSLLCQGDLHQRVVDPAALVLGDVQPLANKSPAVVIRLQFYLYW